MWDFIGDRAHRYVSYNEDGVFQRALGLPETAGFADIMTAMTTDSKGR